MRVLAHVVPGLEDVALEEVAERFPGARLAGIWRGFDERTSIVELREVDEPCAWLDLDTVEDVFVLAARAHAIERGGLGALTAATLTSKLLEPALRTFASCRGRLPRTYRVIARMAGSHAYRRVDAQRAVLGALKNRLPRLHPVPDNSDVELWLSVVGRDALLGVRISTAAMRRAPEQDEHAPAALRPTVARAMVRLSRPRPDDVVLDPFCGVGTLLLERGRAAPAAALVGGDRDPAAVHRARRNLRGTSSRIELESWDALDLPLQPGSVDVVLTNPPFGRRLPIPGGDVEGFYGRAATAFHRVLRPGGRLVLITSQAETFARTVRQRAAPFVVRRRLPVLLRGERAAIFVCERA